MLKKSLSLIAMTSYLAIAILESSFAEEKKPSDKAKITSQKKSSNKAKITSFAEEKKPSDKAKITSFAEEKKPSDKAKITSQKKFSYGINSSYQKSNFSFDTPAAHSILKWQEMNGYSIGTELKYKVFDTNNDYNTIKGSDVFFSYDYSKLSGSGTDDDITNAKSFAAFSVQKAKGNSHDIRVGTNLDFKEYNNITPSIRFGGFYKKLKFDMNDGKILLVDFDQALAGLGKLSGLGQRTNSVFTGVTIGGKISHKLEGNENVLIVDFYPAVQYTGNQHWPHRNLHWKLKSATPGMGLKVALEHHFKVSEQNLKIFSSYEYIKINKLNESGTNYSVKGGSSDSSVNGEALFNSLNMGIGLYF